ncbi:hypothetical protein HQ524_04465 [Candidatus Uhrbacteria bacterium]|nr:hypothetical protein [Candidatus Uhrbacteria bacterium]
MNGRFDFIENDTLKENIAIYVQYIVFLVSIEEEYDVGILTYSIYKDIVMHTAHVVESLINYKLQKLISDGDIAELDLVGYSDKFTNKKMIHRCDDSDDVYCFVRLSKTKNKIKGDTKFLELNRAGKKSGLLTTQMFTDCENIREMRNRIHLSGLSGVDDKYSKKDIVRIFKITERLIDRVRDFDI